MVLGAAPGIPSSPHCPHTSAYTSTEGLKLYFSLWSDKETGHTVKEKTLEPGAPQAKASMAGRQGGQQGPWTKARDGQDGGPESLTLAAAVTAALAARFRPLLPTLIMVS